MDILSILTKMGFDWQVALANTFNFLIIFFILKHFAFKPIKSAIEKRKNVIQEGLDKAQEAEVRLKEVDEINIKKIKEAEVKSVEIIKATEKRAKDLELQLQKKNEESQQRLQKEIQEDYEKQQQRIRDLVFKNATVLVKKAVVKTVELSPEAVDEALIEKALKDMDNEEK